MFHKIVRAAVVFSVLSIVSWISYGTFRYFTYAEKPVISLKDLENNKSYQGTLEAAVVANHTYKIASVKLLLDGKPFNPMINDKPCIPNKISSKRFSLPFTLNTTELSQGKHLLEALVTDSSYHQNTNHFVWQFYADNIPLKAVFLQQEYKVDQGKTAHLKVNVSKQLKKAEVSVFSKTFKFSADADSNLYECFIPIDCEQKPCEIILTADLEDAVGNQLTLSTNLAVLEFAFKKQKGFLVSTEKMDAEKEISLDSKILNEAIEKWLEKSPNKKLWAGPFLMPMEVKRITTPHGEIRMTPARGRYMHKGIDLVNMPKSVVWASQTGMVIIKDRFMVGGNTVVIDHGLGVFTKYCHLDSFTDIEVGDVIKKGNPIGRVGMTGYASGYHLHWELLVNNIAIDPTEWTTTIY